MSRAAATAPGSTSTMQSEARRERDHSRWRIRHALVPRNPGGVEAAVAGLRQAPDLLSLVDADARRDSRHPRHIHTARHPSVRAAAGRWRALGHASVLRRATIA